MGRVSSLVDDRHAARIAADDEDHRRWRMEPELRLAHLVADVVIERLREEFPEVFDR